ncbi:MAG: TetR family transcriptional regulator [Umezawaea sp.]
MDTPTAPTAPRRRDAAATRAALLAAARELMAKHGVKGTSTRDVAAAAGVNQALVYRYFGSKEKLFAEVVKDGAEGAESEIATTPLADLPHVLLTRALAHVGEPGTGSLSALVTAANDDTVRAHIRERIQSGFGARLAPRLEGPDVELRAELLAALITGIGFLRGKIGTPAISAADQELLGHYVDLMCAPLLAAPDDGGLESNGDESD